MDSLEQERRELLEAVLAALAAPECDADRAAACFRLLDHLGRGAGPLKTPSYGRHQPPMEARKREYR